MVRHDKLVGVIGGMGPDATIDFMSRVISHTDASIDQQHVRLLVEQNPHIPNRQLAMRGDGEDPGVTLRETATRLQMAGVDFVVMPCNLAHAWESDILDVLHVPFVSIISVTVAEALQQSGDEGAIGLMTTPGCFSAGMYQKQLSELGRPVVEQTNEELEETMHWVEKIKAGERSVAVRDGLTALGNRLIQRGATALIAACTEFPLVLDESMFDVAFVSSTDALAKKTIALARLSSD